MALVRTSEIDMADSVAPSDIEAVLTDAAWAICSTYHTVLKASPGAAIFGQDMLFDIPFIADWTKIGDYSQGQTDLNTMRENKKQIDFDYKVGDKILILKDAILRKSESPKQKNMNNNTTSYKWNNQGYTPNQVGTIKCPKSTVL